METDKASLLIALRNLAGTEITDAAYTERELQGGTLAAVYLLEGTAEAANGQKHPFRLVRKTQQRWERPGDPDSWRREYDLYHSPLDEVFTDELRRPKCYHAELDGETTTLWLEFLEGTSGSDLTPLMLSQTARAWAHFQGRAYTQLEPADPANDFGDAGFLRRNYAQWHTQLFTPFQLTDIESPLPEAIKKALQEGRIPLIQDKSFEYSYLRSDECTLPLYLKQMLYDIDDNLDATFAALATLPTVLCHRDLWAENIFLTRTGIRLIDWDTAGYGYAGEDLASLIADDIDFNQFGEICTRCIPAYYETLAQYLPLPADRRLREMILILFGYRTVQSYLYADNENERREAQTALQKIHDMPR